MKASLKDVRAGALARTCVVALLLFAIAALTPALAAASTAKTALIDGESVTTLDGIEKGGTPISLEQYAAEHAGYTVTVRSGAEWETMSAEEFAQYQLLIVGDPKCSSTAVSAVNSAHTWIPVVMGKSGLDPLVGNRVLVGTDPEYHYANGEGGAQPTEPGNPSSAGAEHLVQDGITFAGGVAGATGVYFDTSCTDLAELDESAKAAVSPASTPQEEIEGPDGRDITEVLDHLTATSETWEEDTEPPCGGNVQQIVANPVFDEGETKLLDSNIEGWECSVHVAFPHFPADWFALAVATDAATHPTCGIDPETKEEACGEAYVLLAGEGIVARAANLTLTPETHTDPAGASHSVTAIVSSDGKPLAGAKVTFTVTGQNAGASGTCTNGAGADPECMTDANGEVTFTYSDAKGTGQDTIIASVTNIGTTERASSIEQWVAQPVTVTVTPSTPTNTPTSTPASTTPATAKGGVLAFGAAKLASSGQACVASSGYNASVSGKAIKSVTFTLDGHKLKVLSKPNSHGAFTLHINVKPGSAHHLSIHVVFTPASHTSSLTIHKTLARCAAVHRVTEPRFTG